MSRQFRLIALLILIVLGAAFFPEAGNLLVVQDSFSHAEMAVLLSGNPVERALAVRDLYSQGRVTQALIIPEPPNRVEGELIKLGVLQAGLPPVTERILVASGVPRWKITFLQATDGTISEALEVQRYLRAAPSESVVIVTSRYSSRRARFIFRSILKNEKVKVYCFPSPYDPFEPNRWWSRARDALNVVMEYMKFIPNVVTLVIEYRRV